MPRILYAMNEPELNNYISHINNISLIRSEMALEEISAATDKIKMARDEDRKIYTLDEMGVGHINVLGVLEQNVNPCAILFGMETTAYFEIINAVAEAENNPDVKKVTFHFDTPGGTVVGLEKTANVIKSMTKPTTGIVHGQCCSAGLFLASQCSEIVAEGELNEVGSLGVKVVLTDTSARERANGITRYTIVSENAPNKVLDPSQKNDRMKLQQHITKMEKVFIDFVASGRNTTPEFVRKNYGRGAVLLAREALEVGMIDSIQNEMVLNDQNRQASGENQSNKTTMEDNMADITMSEEDFKKYSKDLVAEAVAESTASFTAKLEERDAKMAAENERKAGFNVLLQEFPNQKEMINEEMAKEGATASAMFAIKVANAETARVAALNEQTENQEENVSEEAQATTDDANKDVQANTEFNDLASALNLDVKVEGK